MNDKVDEGVFTHSSTRGPTAPAMQATIPGIANTCRATEGTSFLFTIGNKSVNASGEYVEPSFFKMFTLPFILLKRNQGAKNDIANSDKHNSIVLTFIPLKFFVYW